MNKDGLCHSQLLPLQNSALNSALFLTESLATVAVAILLLLISAMLLPVGGPSNEWRGVGGSALNGMPEIFSYAPPGPFSFSRPELIIV